MLKRGRLINPHRISNPCSHSWNGTHLIRTTAGKRRRVDKSPDTTGSIGGVVKDQISSGATTASTYHCSHRHSEGLRPGHTRPPPFPTRPPSSIALDHCCHTPVTLDPPWNCNRYGLA
eukprot:scaffold131823_cov31-Tisochrysis_lutea.AAC.4